MIDQLFDGTIVPAQVNYQTDPKYRRAEAVILEAEEALLLLLEEDAQQYLAAFTDAYIRLQDAIARRAFKEGFCLACELAGEVRAHYRQPPPVSEE